MIKIHFDPEALEGERREEWLGLIRLAEEAAGKDADARAAGETPKWRKKAWTDIRTWMFKYVSHGKCAYCEATVDTVYHGEAEHWRPKGPVAERNPIGDVAVRDARGVEHPGYYWAAYDWRNLLPTCKWCNSGSAATRGKLNVFPVNGTRVFSPDEASDFERLNDIEKPLLLHPLLDSPEMHLDFDEFGQPVAMSESEKGAATIKVLGLDREPLNTKRHKLHNDIHIKVKQAMSAQLVGGPTLVEALKPLFESHHEFALAQQKYVMRCYAELAAAEFAADALSGLGS